MSIAAQIGMAPVAMRLFGTLQILSVFPNLLVIPLASLTTVLAMLSCLLVPVGGWIALPARWLLHGILFLAGLFAELPAVTVKRLPYAALPVLYTGMFCFTRYFHPQPREARYAAGGVLGLLLVVTLIA